MADSAVEITREWLTSDATVERVARHYFKGEWWDALGNTNHEMYRERFRAALAAAMVQEAGRDG